MEAPKLEMVTERWMTLNNCPHPSMENPEVTTELRVKGTFAVKTKGDATGRPGFRESLTQG